MTPLGRMRYNPKDMVPERRCVVKAEWTTKWQPAVRRIGRYRVIETRRGRRRGRGPNKRRVRSYAGVRTAPWTVYIRSTRLNKGQRNAWTAAAKAGRRKQAAGRKGRGKEQHGERQESERKRRQQSREEGDQGKQQAAAGGREAKELHTQMKH